MQESELILDYDDWSVYYDHEKTSYIYVDNDTKEWKYVEPMGVLHYDINNLPRDCDDLFDCFCCGERVTDDEIIYYWFKEID